MGKPAKKLFLAKPLKLDLGCGKNKVGPEWTGVDSRKFEGVDLVLDLCVRLGSRESPPFRLEDCGKLAPWPWESDSVEEVHCSHFVEHLEPDERIHFANELFRILKPGATARIITPHWNSMRAYGDLTHKWPPVSEFWFHYLNKAWRDVNAPHNDQYTCDFEAPAVLALVFGQGFMDRNDEMKHFAAYYYREGATDLIATLTKPAEPR